MPLSHLLFTLPLQHPGSGSGDHINMWRVSYLSKPNFHMTGTGHSHGSGGSGGMSVIVGVCIDLTIICTPPTNTSSRSSSCSGDNTSQHTVVCKLLCPDTNRPYLLYIPIAPSNTTSSSTNQHPLTSSTTSNAVHTSSNTTSFYPSKSTSVAAAGNDDTTGRVDKLLGYYESIQAYLHSRSDCELTTNSGHEVFTSSTGPQASSSSSSSHGTHRSSVLVLVNSPSFLSVYPPTASSDNHHDRHDSLLSIVSVDDFNHVSFVFNPPNTTSTATTSNNTTTVNSTSTDNNAYGKQSHGHKHLNSSSSCRSNNNSNYNTAYRTPCIVSAWLNECINSPTTSTATTTTSAYTSTHTSTSSTKHHKQYTTSFSTSSTLPTPTTLRCLSVRDVLQNRLIGSKPGIGMLLEEPVYGAIIYKSIDANTNYNSSGSNNYTSSSTSAYKKAKTSPQIRLIIRDIYTADIITLYITTADDTTTDPLIPGMIVRIWRVMLYCANNMKYVYLKYITGSSTIGMMCM